MVRPIILNGITQIAEQPDLIDRSIFINMPLIDPAIRKSESEILSSVDNLRPKIIGLICDSLVSILGAEEKQNENMPRMADFARFVSKTEKYLVWQEGEFVNVMNENRLEALKDLNEYDPLLNAITAYATKKKRYGFVFQGTPTMLLQHLTSLSSAKPGKSGLPDNPATLSKRLNGLKPVLREMGIQITDKKSGDKREKRIDWIKIDENGTEGTDGTVDLG